MDAATNNLASLERIINYVFNNKMLGVLALHSDGLIAKNDRLAIVGDKAIDMVLCDLWFDAQDSQGRLLDKGQWTQIQQDIVSNKHLAERGFGHGLDRFVIKNPGHYGPISERMMATAVEAVIGAVDKDTNGDRNAVRAVMDTLGLGFFEHPLLMVTYCDFPSLVSKTYR